MLIIKDVQEETMERIYTSNMNPDGTVNIKIIRGKDGKITGVSYQRRL